MSVIKADTFKMKQTVNSLNTLNKRYIDYIESIKDIAVKDHYWKGADGDAFREDLKNTCVVYDEVAIILKQYATFMESYAKELENVASLGKIR